MDDMTALERQIGTVLGRMGGPEPQFDAMAIVRTASTSTTPRWRFQSMFSATKIVVAGGIVALFGGFLVAGVMTQPGDDGVPAVGATASATIIAEPSDAATGEPEPTKEVEPDGSTIAPSLLPGVDLVTEEVDTGVYRVLRDGAGHDLVAEPPVDVTVAPDGSVWLLRGISWNPGLTASDRVDAVYRLGQAGTHTFEPADTSDLYRTDIAVDTDDGTWLTIGADIDGATLGTFDGSSWMAPTWPDGSTGVAGIESTDDGAIWVTLTVEDGPGPRVARIVDGEWTVLPPLADPTLEGYFHAGPRYFAATTDGTAWLANGNFHAFDKVTSQPHGLLHFDGTGWQVVELPVNDQSAWRAGPLELGSDGTLWVYLENRTRPSLACRSGYLARLSDGEWSLFRHRPKADRVPPIVCGQGPEARLAVDRDGRLWVAAHEGGVHSFDGTTWQHHLVDLHVNGVDVRPDGSVIAVALYECRGGDCDGRSDLNEDLTRAGLYVITPEAVAAAQ